MPASGWALKGYRPEASAVISELRGRRSEPVRKGNTLDINSIVLPAVENPDGRFADCFGEGGVGVCGGVQREHLGGHQ